MVLSLRPQKSDEKQNSILQFRSMENKLQALQAALPELLIDPRSRNMPYYLQRNAPQNPKVSVRNYFFHPSFQYSCVNNILNSLEMRQRQETVDSTVFISLYGSVSKYLLQIMDMC